MRGLTWFFFVLFLKYPFFLSFFFFSMYRYSSNNKMVSDSNPDHREKMRLRHEGRLLVLQSDADREGLTEEMMGHLGKNVNGKRFQREK